MTFPVAFTIMDLVDGMRTFVAAVKTGSFTAASERLGISKKLVSKYVAQLEYRLGVRLLHRTTRKLSLTEAGRRYYDGSVELLEDLDALEGTLLSQDKALAGTLKIAAPTSFGELYVLPLVRQFKQLNPELTVDLRLSDRYADLADEGIDVAVRIGSLDDSNLISRRLIGSEIWVVASPEFIQQNGEPKTPGELEDFDSIRDTNSRSGHFIPFEVDGHMQKIPIDGKFLVNSAMAVKELALLGEGIGIGPDFVVWSDVESGHLVRLLPGFSSWTMDISAVFLNTHYMPARQRLFMDFLVDSFRSCSGWNDLVSALLNPEPQ